MELIRLSEADEQLVSRAREFAVKAHNDTGCEYSGYSYDLHLKAVVNVGRQYLGLIPKELQAAALCALWLHDTMEDCRMNYNDVKTVFGEQVADCVYRVTNELGRNRAERADKTYPKIAESYLSTWVKLCDRISNMRFSYFVWDEKGMFRKYQSEHEKFESKLYNEEHGFDLMWEELRTLASY